ncbi:MAG: hypothetical protein AB2A00_22625 [Myxococcota bacterium]
MKNNMMMSSLLGAIAGGLVAGTAAWATGGGGLQNSPLPTLIPYQGRLEAGGRPANGTYQLQFHLYDGAQSASELWTSSTADVLVREGYFSVLLGENPGPAITQRHTTGEMFVGISINGQAMEGRQRILPSAYAFSAAPGVTFHAAHVTADNVDAERVVATDVEGTQAVSTSKYELKGGFTTSDQHEVIGTQQLQPLDAVAANNAWIRYGIGTRDGTPFPPGHQFRHSFHVGSPGQSAYDTERMTVGNNGVYVNGVISFPNVDVRRLAGIERHFYAVDNWGNAQPSQDVTMLSNDVGFCFLTRMQVDGRSTDDGTQCQIHVTPDGFWHLTANYKVRCEAYCIKGI